MKTLEVRIRVGRADDSTLNEIGEELQEQLPVIFEHNGIQVEDVTFAVDRPHKSKWALSVASLMQQLHEIYGVTNEPVHLYTADGCRITDWRMHFGDPLNQSVMVFLGDPE